MEAAADDKAAAAAATAAAEGERPMDTSGPLLEDDFEYAPEDKASTIRFAELCHNLQQCAEASGHDTKVACVMTERIARHVGSESVYPYLRLLLPKQDSSQRGKYQIKEKTAATLFVDRLGLTDKEAKRLTSFADHNVNGAHFGDFTSTLEDVLNHEVKHKNRTCGLWANTITVGMINSRLDELVRAQTSSERGNVLYSLTSKLTPSQMKWLMRIVLEDLKVGLKADTVFPRVHPDMREEYQKSMNLRRTCSIFAGRRSTERVASEVQVGTPFQPMVAQRLKDMTTAEATLHGDPFAMEIKVDGERMLCHKDGDVVHWLSRKGKSYTGKYGPALNPWLKSNIMADRCILDGEVVTYDNRLGRLRAFGHNRTHAREEADALANGVEEGNGCDFQLFYILFDVLHAEGPHVEKAIAAAAVEAKEEFGVTLPGPAPRFGGLVELPLAVRRGLLRRLLTQEPHRLELVHSQTAKAGDHKAREKQLLDYYETAVGERQEEGLVVKNLKAKYVIGEKESRKSKLWIKMKPEYGTGGQNLDMIIMGAHYSESSRRAGLLTQFLVGVKREPIDGEGSGPPKFLYTGRVSCGLSFEQVKELNQKLEGKWQEYDRSKPLPEWAVDREGRPIKVRGPDSQGLRIIRPEDSVILEVKMAELVGASYSATGLQLRFPRIERVRYDKAYYACDDLHTLDEMNREGRNGLRKRAPVTNPADDEEDEVGGGGRRRRPRKRQRRGPQIAQPFKVADTSNIVATHAAFRASPAGPSLEFCVMATPGNRYALDVAGPGMDGAAGGSGGGGGLAAAAADAGSALKMEYTKHELEEMIAAGGGTVQAAPSVDTYAVIAGAMTDQLKNLMKGGNFNIVRFSWVVESALRGSFKPPTYNDFIAMDPVTKAKLENDVDPYGDHYTELVTARQLKLIFDRVAAQNAALRHPSPHKGQQPQRRRPWREILFDENLFDDEDRALLARPDWFFWQGGAVFYVDEFDDLGRPEAPTRQTLADNEPFWAKEEQARKILTAAMEATAYRLDLAGAALSRSLCLAVTHVIVDPWDRRRFRALRERLRELHTREEARRGVYPRKLVLDYSWVKACTDAGAFVPHEGYVVSLVDLPLPVCFDGEE